MAYFFVGMAGFLGASFRYIIGIVLYDADVYFPFSTLFVNLLGSFFLAWFTFELFNKFSLSSKMEVAIGTGFVGSFTTFSTLSIETVLMLEKGITSWL
ncbi:CrcB family protein [Halobacillus shinanisalinarum]|uniref:Fluoride-specific ion channel n=1 Tax=Halobacillus shinanisalinarum TaxID=2932258 RepID=A0ABY4GXE6_9BACI|nr:CrcB family protein [Halobacillus shinanisalinarum]UOQ92390.1 CrcB family protein [Halobacillus shinanisalinarum]